MNYTKKEMRNNTKSLEILKIQYPIFIYENYSKKIVGKDLVIEFQYKIEPNIYFSPTIQIKNIPRLFPDILTNKMIDNLIFHLGIAEMISYWKATCSPEIIIRPGHLNKHQIKWWKKSIVKGMGEFFFLNNIDFTKPNFLKIVSNAPKTNTQINFKKKLSNRVIVPLGGGKDSVVTLNMLKGREKLNTLILNPIKASLGASKKAGFQKPIIINREIDSKLIKLNNGGFLNGHTPFSLYLAFLSTLCAVIFDFKYIAVSNETSANEENIIFKNKKINHQYSKSFDFEKAFDKYSQKYLAQDVHYFSFLRPLHELQIAQLFSRYKNYFGVFKSCNKNQRKNSWCGKCAKCLSVFIMLYPFLDKEQLKKTFSRNLLQDKNLLNLLKSLIGEISPKPFDCVGTKNETIVALYLSLIKEKRENKKIPYLISYFEENILPNYTNINAMTKKLLNSWDKNNLLPIKFTKILQESLRNNVSEICK